MSRPQDIGGDFERRFAELIGGEVVPGSGSGAFAKGDVRGRSTVWSLKATRNNSFSVTKPMLDELHAMRRAGGYDHAGFAFEVAGMIVVLHPVQDYLSIMADEEIVVTASRADAKRASALVPPRMRED